MMVALNNNDARNIEIPNIFLFKNKEKHTRSNYVSVAGKLIYFYFIFFYDIKAYCSLFVGG